MLALQLVLTRILARGLTRILTDISGCISIDRSHFTTRCVRQGSTDFNHSFRIEILVFSITDVSKLVTVQPSATNNVVIASVVMCVTIYPGLDAGLLYKSVKVYAKGRIDCAAGEAWANESLGRTMMSHHNFMPSFGFCNSLRQPVHALGVKLIIIIGVKVAFLISDPVAIGHTHLYWYNLQRINFAP